MGETTQHPTPADLNRGSRFMHAPFASPPLILGKSRVRKRARTGVCGAISDGRPYRDQNFEGRLSPTPRVFMRWVGVPAARLK